MLFRSSGFIPGLGRFPGEGTGYPRQDSWASLVVQLVKNPPTKSVQWGGGEGEGGKTNVALT